MTAEQVVAWSFLAVSAFGLSVQLWALSRLWRARQVRGLARTSACRAGCAVLYVLVGINALDFQWAVLQVTFVSFCVTQATWQINAWLDVRLEHSHHRRPRHRYVPERRFRCHSR